MDIRKLQRAIVDGLEDVKAQDIVVFNTEHLSPLFERVIIASGTSNRQTKALAASVRDAVRQAGFQIMRTEGESNGEWIIVDCAAAVVHLMQPAIRQYYQLEEIWGDKPVAITLKSAKKGLVKASEPEDEDEPVKPKKASGKVTEARKAATTPARKVVAAKKAAPAKKAAAVKTAAKAPAKKVAAKKVVAKKAVITSVKAPVAVKKVAAKKVAAKKVAAKKAAPSIQKVVVNAPKKAPAKKVAVKRVAAKKVARKTAR
jgi:ribosome-associated protein